MGIKEKSIQEYVGRVIDTVGSDLSVGRFLGLTDGSRVGQWRKGRGRPSELMCIKMARWQGDDLLDVLRIAGYSEMADLLDGQIPEVSGRNLHSVNLLKHQLTTLQNMVEMALQQTENMGGPDGEKAQGSAPRR